MLATDLCLVSVFRSDITIQTMMSYSLDTKEEGKLYILLIILTELQADQPMKIRGFFKQTPSANVSLCAHGVILIMFEPGCLSDLQTDPPSAALSGHICLTT